MFTDFKILSAFYYVFIWISRMLLRLETVDFEKETMLLDDVAK